MFSPPLVIKLGGSLYSRAGEICAFLLERSPPVLVVPGGGPFARAVRETGAGGTAAHWMAVAAMEQFGWYLSRFGIPVTGQLSVSEGPRVLLPYIPLRSADPLPHSWDVTSDTIAAWCAWTLGVPLVLLKAVDGIRSGGRLLRRVDAPVETGDVDPCFLGFVLERGVPAVVISGLRLERLAAVLDGAVPRGTTIGF
ncbi:MAG: uridylate kinase [Methanolinea sp.]|nr:uridylate kinase [Methanolinea sp.]